MKKLLKIIGLLLAIIIVVVIIFVATYKPKKYTDFGMYEDTYTWTAAQYEQRLQPRAINDFFKNFYQPLSFPFSKIFGGSNLGVDLKSYESEQLSAATVSRFEMPPGSGYYTVVTLNLLPRFNCRAPIMHVDFMKPSAGVPGMLIMDYFNVDTDAISVEEFFGEDIAAVKQALAMVDQYQRTEEQGRGEISRYLDPYKSSYRIELMEPKTDDTEVRRAYYTAARDAIKLVLPVYLKRIAMLQPEPSFAAQHEKSQKKLVSDLFENDFAVKMGRNIFKENFSKYWVEGFWNVGFELPADK